MKKILITLLAITAVFVIITYLFVPAHIEINETVKVNCAQNGANRIINDSTKWLQWWPGDKADGYRYNQSTYHPKLPAFTGLQINVVHHDVNLESLVALIPVTKDSTSITWHCILTTSLNPITRIRQRKYVENIQADMRSILSHLKTYLENTKNIYGIQVITSKVTDTLLISTKNVITHYPTTEDVYALINKLRTAIQANHIEATNYPMLNITEKDSNSYAVQVAIPVNREINESNDISIKRMVPGKILISNEINGGPYTIGTSFKSMETYVADYQKTVMAIPFQSLITDRAAEKDTSKWITKFYYPVY